MANKARGEVDLAVGGRSFTLRLSINAICELETELEKRGLDSNYLTFFTKARQGRLNAARLLLWACLRDHHPSVTVSEAGELIEELGELATVWDALADAMSAQTPDAGDLAAVKADAGAGPIKARAGGTGTRSAGRRGSRDSRAANSTG